MQDFNIVEPENRCGVNVPVKIEFFVPEMFADTEDGVFWTQVIGLVQCVKRLVT